MVWFVVKLVDAVLHGSHLFMNEHVWKNRTRYSQPFVVPSEAKRSEAVLNYMVCFVRKLVDTVLHASQHFMN